ncbi:Ankyrin repeat protein [Pyrenophora tritici-repentis]|nr:Ankyrin repeat protein [Pyrenophora tritici-repentis]
MRKRDRIQNRVRALLASDTNVTHSAPPTRTAPLPSAQQTASPRAPLPSSPPCLTRSSAGLSAATTSHSLVLEKALAKALEKLPEAERAVFAQASKTIDEQTLLFRVQTYDATHKDDSLFRPHAERLSKLLDLLNRFMGGVAIGIQASPEISSLVVGSVRVVIDLALKFTMYFSKLTDMICTFEDYLGPLAEYARAADVNLVETTVVNAYANVLGFSYKARRVFVDANGDQRKWISLRAFMRQHWETFESEFATIKEDLQHHLDVLLHSVQSLHFDFSRKAEQARRRAEERRERSAFLAWVSSIDFEKTHQDIYAKKHEKTCGWLIIEPKYQQWFNSPASSLLWCHGKPGIGKSVLASSVIEDITTTIGLREDAGLCFVYYNYQNTQLKELHQIVATLLKQLCQRKDQLPRDLLQTKQEALSPSLVGTQERFISLVEDLSQVYVVFDALDECPEQERGDILGFITGIVRAQVGCQVKVFVTSRNEMDIAKAFGDKHIPTIQIQTENVTADIEAFARSQVTKLQAGENGKTLYITNDGLKEKIIQTLAAKAEGMFLWVNLQLDSLCQASKAQKDRVVEAALEALPQGLLDTYVRILERIEAQSPYMRDLALKCLAWTVYARRPLSTRELQLALAINPTCTAQQDLQTDSPQVILEACGNILEEANGSIRPIHFTVQEFLTTTITELSQHTIRAQLLDPTSMHRRLSLVCLAYIRLTAFDKPAQHSLGLYMRLQKDVLAGYACQSFDYHISNGNESSVDVIDQLEALLRQESAYLASVLQIKVLRDGHGYYAVIQRFNGMNFPVTPGTIVYSTSLYNIPTVRQRWVDQTPPIYALHLAASAGLTSAVIRLLEGGYNVDEKDGHESTSLYYACLNGDVDVVQVLIDKNAEVNAQGGYYGNALQAASARGYEQIVKMLLDKGADVNAQGGCYGNALQAASFGGHEQVVKMLLDKGANVNAQGGLYGNALQAASARGYEQIVKMLLDKGADVNAQGGRYGNALQAASDRGHEQVVKMLLDKDADINARSGP